MSLPVYLDGSTLPRMPEGRKGELPGYFSEGIDLELEANGFLPLFWLVLFAPEDLRFAEAIDLYDPVGDASEIADYLVARPDGTDDRYAYLVTERSRALARARARRPAVLGLIGDSRAAIVFDAFMELLAAQANPYLLLRTSGLADVIGAGSAWIEEDLRALERLTGPVDVLAAPRAAPRATPPGAAAPGLLAQVTAIRSASDGEIVYRATGACHGGGAPWPSPGLIRALPACAPRPRRRTGAFDDAAQLVAETPAKSARSARLPAALVHALEWGAAVVLGLAVFLVLFTTGSLLLALAAGIPATALVVLALVWINRR